MSESSNYYPSTSGHLCDLDHCALKTSLKPMAVAIGRQMMIVHVSSSNGWTPTLGAATTPIVIAKFRRLEHEVEVANEELKQARSMGEAVFEREQVAKRRAERAKVARRISKEKAEKFKIALVLSWVMFGLLLILSTRLGEVRSWQKVFA